VLKGIPDTTMKRSCLVGMTLAHLPTDDSMQGPVTQRDDNDRQYGESNIMIEYKQC